MTSIVFAEDQLSTLKKYCDKNQADYWAKNSESCRLVRGEYQLDKLCDGYSKGNTRLSIRLESIAEKYGELKSIESDTALKQLCAKQLDPAVVTAKPDCSEEVAGKKKITRKWWNGSSWGDTQDSLTAIKDKAENGDKIAQFNLGVWHIDGTECIAKDIKVAAPFLCKAYDNGERMAGLQFQKISKHPSDQKAREIFGKEYGCELTIRQQEYAAETKKLEEEAKANLKKAEAGNVMAMVKVGETYLSSDYGFQQNYKEALRWFQKAADKGNPEAMGLIAAMYSRGDIEKDNEEAFKWALKAAEKGDLDSQYLVGLSYYKGQGTEENLSKAIQWLSKAMDHGHSEAKDTLVEMFVRGELQAEIYKSLSERLKKLESKK